jgi:hypothetical protein
MTAPDEATCIDYAVECEFRTKNLRAIMQALPDPADRGKRDASIQRLTAMGQYWREMAKEQQKQQPKQSELL